EAFSYAFVEMMEDVGKWLVVGLLIAALITVAVPNDWLAALHDYKLLNMRIVLAIAIPMYVCATGSIPIAVSLMAKGLTPGAGLVLLMAGPAVNTASMLVIGKVFGGRTLKLYLLSIVVGAMLFGLGIDYLLPQEWFAVQSGITESACHEEGIGLFSYICTALLIIFLLNALLLSHHHHHHHHHEEHSAKEAEALLRYMADHNEHHAEELMELSESFSENVRAKIAEAVEVLNAGNAKLREALEELEKEG
ncbi:MAG: permease, partial [Erysipelotrichales bacterium]|nr:permease [Erysipelotrichales bacterium]